MKNVPKCCLCGICTKDLLRNLHKPEVGSKESGLRPNVGWRRGRGSWWTVLSAPGTWGHLSGPDTPRRSSPGSCDSEPSWRERIDGPEVTTCLQMDWARLAASNMLSNSFERVQWSEAAFVPEAQRNHSQSIQQDPDRLNDLPPGKLSPKCCHVLPGQTKSRLHMKSCLGWAGLTSVVGSCLLRLEGLCCHKCQSAFSIFLMRRGETGN